MTTASLRSVREKFVARFDEATACAIEGAAEEHENGTNSENKGADPFKWALLIAIGYECMSKERYREYHGITAPWDDLKHWMVAEGELASHDGDCDYLALFAGSYNDYVSPQSDPATAGVEDARARAALNARTKAASARRPEGDAK